MRIRYWCAECLDDSDAYNIRARTKGEAERMAASWGGRYGPVFKVDVDLPDVRDRFDLIAVCLGESRGFWEASAAFAAEQARGEVQS